MAVTGFLLLRPHLHQCLALCLLLCLGTLSYKNNDNYNKLASPFYFIVCFGMHKLVFNMCILFFILCSGNYVFQVDEDDGTYFIDRDGRHFHYILVPIYIYVCVCVYFCVRERETIFFLTFSIYSLHLPCILFLIYQ